MKYHQTFIYQTIFIQEYFHLIYSVLFLFPPFPENIIFTLFNFKILIYQWLSRLFGNNHEWYAFSQLTKKGLLFAILLFISLIINIIFILLVWNIIIFLKKRFFLLKTIVISPSEIRIFFFLFCHTKWRN